MWNARSGHLLKTFGLESSNPEVIGGPAQVVFVAFSPDGQFLASGGGFKDPTIRLWHIATGEKRFTLIGHAKNRHSGHTSDIHSVAFSPDGTLLASGGIDAVRLWDPTTSQALAVLTGNRSSVSAVAFSSDGRTLASGEYGAIFLWDVDTALRKHQ